MRNFCNILVVILGLFPCAILGVDESTIHEKECVADRDPKEVNLDLKWMESVKQFYLPLWSKLYAYRISADLLQKPVSDFTQSELDSPTCLTFKDGNVVAGRNHVRTFDITPDETSLTWKVQWDGAIPGKYVFHLTDNKSYILGIGCWEDGQSGWAVLSTETSLTLKAKKDILNYLTNLGFKKELALEESYESCENIKSTKANEEL